MVFKVFAFSTHCRQLLTLFVNGLYPLPLFVLPMSLVVHCFIAA